MRQTPTGSHMVIVALHVFIQNEFNISLQQCIIVYHELNCIVFMYFCLILVQENESIPDDYQDAIILLSLVLSWQILYTEKD